VLAVRPRLADLHALAGWLEDRPVVAGDGLVLIGDGPYPDGEVADALGVPVLGHMPWDPDAAAGLLSLPASDRRLTRTPLVRAARSLTDRLAERPTADRPDPALLTAPGPAASGRWQARHARRTVAATGAGQSRNGSESEGLRR